VLLSLLLLSGCTYSTRNALPAHHKTIAVPVFNNKTYVEDYTRHLEVEVTEATRNAFIQAGELKIAGRENADLILEGEVTRQDREVLRMDRFGDPAEIRLTLRARISLYDVKEARYLLKDQLVTNAEKRSESGVYNLRRGEYEHLARTKAVEDLGRMIARRATERWPEPKK
jgi:GTP cyclohydrolase FolE2